MTGGFSFGATLTPGLYLVATPIGSARDITLRALDILASADVLAAEDTRSLRRLMEIHGIPRNDRPLIPYHDHNGPAQRPKLLQMIRDGQSVAYSSDAGTPMVADPGYTLAREVIAAGLPVTGAPGPVAAIHALTLSGLATDKFAFLGFLPVARGARQKMLEHYAGFDGTLVVYESPRRTLDLIKDCALVLGADRSVAICRELTKKFEEVLRGTLSEMETVLDDRNLKGEVVVCIGRATSAPVVDVEGALRTAMQEMSLKDSVKAVTEAHDLKRRDVYQIALSLAGKD